MRAYWMRAPLPLPYPSTAPARDQHFPMTQRVFILDDSPAARVIPGCAPAAPCPTASANRVVTGCAVQLVVQAVAS